MLVASLGLTVAVGTAEPGVAVGEIERGVSETRGVGDHVGVADDLGLGFSFRLSSSARGVWVGVAARGVDLPAQFSLSASAVAVAKVWPVVEVVVGLDCLFAASSSSSRPPAVGCFAGGVAVALETFRSWLS